MPLQGQQRTKYFNRERIKENNKEMSFPLYTPNLCYKNLLIGKLCKLFDLIPSNIPRLSNNLQSS